MRNAAGGRGRRCGRPRGGHVGCLLLCALAAVVLLRAAFLLRSPHRAGGGGGGGGGGGNVLLREADALLRLAYSGETSSPAAWCHDGHGA